MNDKQILKVEELTKRFDRKGFFNLDPIKGVLAVDKISLQVERGQTLGIVGESGSGKTTLARMIAGLTVPTSGNILIGGQDVSQIRKHDLHRIIQYVFQDPYSALNPRHTIGKSIGVPLRCLVGLGRKQRQTKILSLLELVGLRPDFADRYPHQLSGGQRQRVVIARALAVEPALLVLDEAVSALDVSIQAQILMLLKRLQQELNLTYVFISHDLAVVEHLSSEVIVMFQGQVVEHGKRSSVFSDPQHPYTKKLLTSVPGAAGPN